jgi:hypothetical protein
MKHCALENVKYFLINHPFLNKSLVCVSKELNPKPYQAKNVDDEIL